MATVRAAQFWQPPSVLPPLPPNTIHIWRLLPEARLQNEDYAACLLPEELARAGRLLFPEDQRQSMASRGTLRLLLAHYAGVEAPHALEFVYGAQGKPSLAGSDIRFNLSHTRDLALFSFAREIDLGVDVERIRASDDLDEVARQNFAPAECSALLALPPADRAAAFYRCWTRKEALLKAEGSGLFRALDSFAVSLLPGEPATMLAGTGDWELRHLDVLPDAVGAVAWQRRMPAPAITLLDCSPRLLATKG